MIAMLRSICQAFSALGTRGIPMTPANLHSLGLLPDCLFVGVYQCALRTSYADLIVARQAMVAREAVAALPEHLRGPAALSADQMKPHGGTGPDRLCMFASEQTAMAFVA